MSAIVHQIRSANGNVLHTGRQGLSLVFDFMGRCTAKGGNAEWGHHYRVMKRRTDPPNLVLKCRATGEALFSIGDRDE